jgi:hypothetical protein
VDSAYTALFLAVAEFVFRIASRASFAASAAAAACLLLLLLLLLLNFCNFGYFEPSNGL